MIAAPLAHISMRSSSLNRHGERLSLVLREVVQRHAGEHGLEGFALVALAVVVFFGQRLHVFRLSVFKWRYVVALA